MNLLRLDKLTFLRAVSDHLLGYFLFEFAMSGNAGFQVIVRYLQLIPALPFHDYGSLWPRGAWRWGSPPSSVCWSGPCFCSWCRGSSSQANIVDKLVLLQQGSRLIWFQFNLANFGSPPPDLGHVSWLVICCMLRGQDWWCEGGELAVESSSSKIQEELPGNC